MTLLETALFSDITYKYFEVDHQLANSQYIAYAVSQYYILLIFISECCVVPSQTPYKILLHLHGYIYPKKTS